MLVIIASICVTIRARCLEKKTEKYVSKGDITM
jgi:hypothetical protein